MKKLELTNALSEEKSKKMERMAKKVMKFAQDNGLAKVSFCFISKACDVTDSELDYVSTIAYDKNDNQLYDVALWG